MCPEGTEFHTQQVGAGGLSNRYYMTMTMFAPEGAVTFREGAQGVLEDEIRTVSNGKRSRWFSVAILNEETGEWTYRGAESTAENCIGWTNIVEWYDAEGEVISRETIRMNLANEECFDKVAPIFNEPVATKEFVEEQIAAIELLEGPQGEQGIQGEQGEAGQDGVGVESVVIENNHLMVTLTDGNILDAGEVPGGGAADTSELEAELAEAKAEIENLKEVKQLFLDTTYGVEYEWIYFCKQTDLGQDKLTFNQETAPKFYEDWLPVLETGDDALIEEFIMSIYEQDIYRMYVLRNAVDPEYANRYLLVPVEDHLIQTLDPRIPEYTPVRSLTSWNWSGDEDGGFTIDCMPTSAMVFAFLKVKEEYRMK